MCVKFKKVRFWTNLMRGFCFWSTLFEKLKNRRKELKPEEKNNEMNELKNEFIQFVIFLTTRKKKKRKHFIHY